MLKYFRLHQKFSLVLFLVFTLAVIASGTILSANLNQQAEQTVTAKAALLMQTMLAVRNYTSLQVNPELAPRLETDLQFLPQTVPAYAAREIFEDLRRKPEYTNFFYKEATLNPTNLRDKADEFETELIEKLRANPTLQELSGYRSTPGGDLFYLARPLVVRQESCLRCHGLPENAPKSQLATYGTTNGFGWKLNEIVGAQVLSVPVGEIRSNAQRSLLQIMTIVISGFAIAVLITNLLIQRIVIHPLNRIVKLADAVSMGDMETELEVHSKDEIGSLAQAFNRMKTSLALALEMLNQRRV